MDRSTLIRALHAGLAEAVCDFHAWTGETIETWGVENLLTATCARRLAQAIAETEDRSLLTLEQTFAGVLAFSRRRIAPGRRPDCLRDIVNKPGGKIDIVLWTRTRGGEDLDQPRVMIEIKRSERTQGLRDDAKRVIDFIQAAGAAYDGAVRYGVVATILRAPADGARAAFKAKHAHRLAALQALAHRRRMTLTVSGPRPVADPHDERAHRSASVVYAFSPLRRQA